MRKNTKKWAKRELAILIHKLDVKIAQKIRELYPDCYTCPNSTAHCSHFHRRAIMATRHDPDNLRGACVRCNVFLYGNHGEYSIRLLQEIGRKRFEALARRSRTIKQWSAL